MFFFVMKWNFPPFNWTHVESSGGADAPFEVVTLNVYLLGCLCFRGCVVSAERLFVASLDNLFGFLDESLRPTNRGLFAVFTFLTRCLSKCLSVGEFVCLLSWAFILSLFLVCVAPFLESIIRLRSTLAQKHAHLSWGLLGLKLQTNLYLFVAGTSRTCRNIEYKPECKIKARRVIM